jgi:peroxiredoxin
MKNKILIVIGLLLAVYLVSWALTSPKEVFKAGDSIPALKLVNIHGKQVDIPSTQSKLIHLQFRRFAGCPICNLHLQEFVSRNTEIEAAGIHEVVLFHSPNASLLPYQGHFPFDVVGDPEKLTYKQFGVESSIFSILDVRAWPSIIKGNFVEDRPKGDPEGGALGLPADFLIGTDGKIIASHYGRHAYDNWTVDELLQLKK